MGTSEPDARPRASNWLRVGVPVSLVAVIAVISGFIGLRIGEHRTGVTLHTGRAIVGQEVAVVQADGWTYDVTAPSFWIDGSGSLHGRGWPECLKLGTRPLISFGAVPVTVPGGGGGRAVVWVDCRG